MKGKEGGYLGVCTLRELQDESNELEATRLRAEAGPVGTGGGRSEEGRPHEVARE